ncbi:hypothetical protein VPH35_106401 [Triticum aestivum]
MDLLLLLHDHAAAEESSSSHRHRTLLLPPPHPGIHPFLPPRARNPSPWAGMSTELRIRSILFSSKSKNRNVRKVNLLPPICSACVKGPGQGEAAASAFSSSPMCVGVEGVQSGQPEAYEF